MEKDIFASQSYCIKENTGTHVMSLNPEKLLSIFVEIWIVPKLLRNSIIHVIHILIIHPNLLLNVVTIDGIFQEYFAKIV